MLRIAWDNARKIMERRKLSQTGECCVTIYSKRVTVVDQVVDHYLSGLHTFRKLHAARVCGEHQIFVSGSLGEATDRLIQLKKAGKVSTVNGSACHLVATVNAHYMSQLVRKSKDFRPYLRELSASAASDPVKRVVNL